MQQQKGNLSVNTENLMPIIKKWLYSDRDIFLRELVSNACDAVSKLNKIASLGEAKPVEKPEVRVQPDAEAGTITVEDNGIGMTEEDLENCLGTIANSGSFAFKKDNDIGEDVDIIGQFGVGFYSTFMVAKEVTVITKAFGSDKAYKWHSNGVDGYTIEEAEKENAGTDVILTLKDDTDDEKYSRYLDQYQIQTLVKKYSDYIRFPIKMDVEHTHYGADENAEPEKHIVNENVLVHP